MFTKSLRALLTFVPALTHNLVFIVTFEAFISHLVALLATRCAVLEGESSDCTLPARKLGNYWLVRVFVSFAFGAFLPPATCVFAQLQAEGCN